MNPQEWVRRPGGWRVTITDPEAMLAANKAYLAQQAAAQYLPNYPTLANQGPWQGLGTCPYCGQSYALGGYTPGASLPLASPLYCKGFGT